MQHFRQEMDGELERVWRGGKSHLRRQQRLIDAYGVEGAMREMLSARAVDGSAADRGHHHTRRSLSFREQLRQRPIDKQILEEIYRNLHGKRIERKLKKGVSWEHWITKGDGTAPVFDTSRKGQQTFAFGGHVRLVRAAAHPSQFPTVYRHGAAAARPQPPQRQQVPEVAFIGRTNSGKSSLINALVNATVTPYGHLQGTTSQVRFYDVAQRIVLVDCPGYGYYHPMGLPAVDAANAVRAMRRYLRRAGRHPAGPRATAAAPQGPPRATTTTTTRAEDPHLFLDPPSAAAAEDETADDPRLVHTTADGADSGGRGKGKPRRAAQQRNVRRVFVCVSAHGMQHIDYAYCQLLEDLHIPFSVVITKTDEAPIRYLARLTDYTRSELLRYRQCKELLLVSALRLAGIQQIQSLIGDLAETDGGKGPGLSEDFSAIV
ncbi:hypothetical protein STCU_07628 [Strigomonas culicis]|uniref:G domain-containing protein n=1 Tax=Strigomonas culicis TaxID=28005 RepID=S9U4B8_9TRYP|nr:hypothetical protein STCU_07628 [Strigomonas culicis]|eukprot:EPY23609.1 hypothetical protein STCU_07628 [Strigomonas culicis]